MERLDKTLANAGAGTRSAVKALLKAGRIQVNGLVEKDGSRHIDPAKDTLTLDGEPIGRPARQVWMLNKPAGCVTATEDPGPTVMDYLPPSLRASLRPVGRLDKDTEGFLLITNDGALAHDLLSPRKHVDKVYFAKVSGQFGENEIARFKEGLDIGNGEKSKQARLQILKADVQESEVLITIMEGKFHQVKRMVKAVGSEVLYLKRLSMGSLKLDEELKLGEYRRLTKAELQELKEHRR